MKNCIKIVVALALIFSIFTSTYSTRASASEVVAPLSIEGGGGAKGAYLLAEQGYSRGVIVTESYFMSVADAQAAATKLGFSSKSFLTWTSVGFIPYIGPFATIVVGLSDARALQASTEIRRLTDKGKKVELVVVKDNGFTYYIVREWNGLVSSIKPYPLIAGVTPSVKKRIYK